MSLDITPLINDGRLMISAYGDGKFTVNAKVVTGSILLYKETVDPWPISDVSEITFESLEPLLPYADDYDIIIVGCGALSKAPPKGLREALKAKGLILEWMNSGGAVRTYTVLQTEDRRVLAAILAVE